MSGALPFPRQHLADLQARFPKFEIWYVPRALGGMDWYARRWDEPDLLNSLHANGWAELGGLIGHEQRDDKTEHDKAAQAFNPVPTIRVKNPGG